MKIPHNINWHVNSREVVIDLLINRFTDTDKLVKKFKRSIPEGRTWWEISDKSDLNINKSPGYKSMKQYSKGF